MVPFVKIYEAARFLKQPTVPLLITQRLIFQGKKKNTRTILRVFTITVLFACPLWHADRGRTLRGDACGLCNLEILSLQQELS